MPGISRDDCRARLAAIVEAGIAVLTAFAGLLAEERRALEARDWDSLESAAAAKAKHLGTLETQEATRAACLADGGFAPDATDDCLAWCDPDGRLGLSWQRYRELADDCSRTNRTNGAIIRARQLHLSAALAVMSGTQPAQSTYGPSGPVAGHGSRALARA